MPDWRTDRDAFRLEYTNREPAITGNAASLGGTPIGAYRRARRAKAHVVDLGAPWLPVGVETSLVIHADGELYAQGTDGCAIEGRALDSLEGVWRGTFTNSCAPGMAFAGFGGSVKGVFYVAAIGGLETIVIAASP